MHYGAISLYNIPPQASGAAVTLCHLHLRQSWRFSCEFSDFKMSGCTLTPRSLDMTKGKPSCSQRHVYLIVTSVMSGVITGPHFRRYFNYPKAIELGTMVAILEVGAFCACVLSTCIEDIYLVP
jgi:hypothetical protein